MIRVAEMLAPTRCQCQARVGSKKSLFELIADLAAPDEGEFHPTELVAGLVAREKLGSTGLGGGIAIPHCRLRDCEAATGVLLSLDTALPFEAPDQRDVDLVFALVVPQEASQEHLELLAVLARLFSDTEFCEALRACRTAEALHNTTINRAEALQGLPQAAHG